jgi:hypothetical protein
MKINARGYDQCTVSSFIIGHKEVMWQNQSLTGGNTGNLPPIADAGNDISSFVNQEITFDGSGSYDPNSDTLSYYWDLEMGNLQLV